MDHPKAPIVVDEVIIRRRRRIKKPNFLTGKGKNQYWILPFRTTFKVNKFYQIWLYPGDTLKITSTVDITSI